MLWIFEGGGAIVPGTTYELIVDWAPAYCRLYVDRILRVDLAGPAVFDLSPDTAYWGTTDAATRIPADAVLS